MASTLACYKPSWHMQTLANPPCLYPLKHFDTVPALGGDLPPTLWRLPNSWQGSLKTAAPIATVAVMMPGKPQGLSALCILSTRRWCGAQRCGTAAVENMLFVTTALCWVGPTHVANLWIMHHCNWRASRSDLAST
jgi:hypothetical protein